MAETKGKEILELFYGRGQTIPPPPPVLSIYLKVKTAEDTQERNICLLRINKFLTYPNYQ